MQITETNPVITYKDDGSNWTLAITHRLVTAAERSAFNIPTAQDSWTINHVFSADFGMFDGNASENTRFFAAAQGDWDIKFFIGENNDIIGWEMHAIVGWEFENGWNIQSIASMLGVAKGTLVAQGFSWPTVCDRLDALAVLVTDVMDDIADRSIHWTTFGEG